MAKLSVTSIAAVADPQAFKEQTCGWFSILPAHGTGQTFGFVKHKREERIYFLPG